MALKKFKVHYKSDDGSFEDSFEVESANKETLYKEFDSLKMGTIIDVQEITSVAQSIKSKTENSVLGSKSEFYNKDISKIKEDKNNIITEVKDAWTTMTLHDGTIIKVSDNGKVQERFWEDVDIAKCLDFGFRFVSTEDNSIVNKLPAKLKLQREVWKIIESNEK